MIEKIVRFALISGFDILRLDYSPIKGPEGNIEYLIYLRKNKSQDERVLGLDEKTAEDILQTDEYTLNEAEIESIKRLAKKAAASVEKEES